MAELTVNQSFVRSDHSFRILKIRLKEQLSFHDFAISISIFLVQFCQCNFFCRSCIYTLQICLSFKKTNFVVFLV